jgi:hypothetical protein
MARHGIPIVTFGASQNEADGCDQASAWSQSVDGQLELHH